MKIELQEKIENRTAVVAVIGLGYVGLPLMKAFCDAGLAVLGFDVDAKKIEMLRRGENYLTHLGEQFAQSMLASDRFDVTVDFGRLAEADAILVCVPTPLDRHLQPDLSFVEQTAHGIAATLRPGQLIVLESTTYPGTTRQLLLPKLEAGGHTCGRDFYLAYSPEREDPGSAGHCTRTIPKLVGGIDGPSTELATALYAHAVDEVIAVSSAEIAESAKLLENIYRAVNIAMVNEMKVLLTEMDIDVWQVIQAAATKPFGFSPFYPGPGLGGHCIPIDPYYLSWKAREMGLPTRFIELAGEVNRAMPQYVVQRTILALNRQGRAIHGEAVLILGLAYKPDIDDVRESPSFELIEKLQALGALVSYNDPHVPSTHKMRHHDLKMTSVELSPETLAQYACVLIATNHSTYDWQMIADHANLIIDTRGAMRKVSGRRDHIVSA